MNVKTLQKYSILPQNKKALDAKKTSKKKAIYVIFCKNNFNNHWIAI